MIAPINPEPIEPEENAGSTGGQGLKPGGEGSLFADPAKVADDCRLIRRAMANGWRVSKRTKRALVSRLSQIAEEADDQTAINAARTLIAADANDIRLLGIATAREGTRTTVNVAVGVNVQNTVESLLSDPNYAAYLESRAGSDSGTVCGNGHAGKVPEAKPHPGHFNGHN